MEQGLRGPREGEVRGRGGGGGAPTGAKVEAMPRDM